MKRPMLMGFAISVLAAAAMVAVWASSPEADKPYSARDVTVFSVRVPEGERQGLMLLKTGRWVIPPYYDKVAWFTSSRSDRPFEGLVAVRVGNQWGLVDPHGKAVIALEYDQAFGSWNRDGLAWVQKGGKWAAVDRTGKLLFAPRFHTIASLSEGMIPVKEKGRFGYLNAVGQVVIEPQYKGAGIFSEGLAPVVMEKKRGFIDKAGKMVISPRFDRRSVQHFSEGMAGVRQETQWGFIDKTGEWAIPPQFSEVRPFIDGLAAVRIGTKWGVIDKTGRVIIQPEYAEISYGQGNPLKLEGTKDGQRFAVLSDHNGTLITPILDEIGEFSEGVAFVKRNGKYGFIDRTGKIVIEPQFDSARSFSSGLAAVEAGGQKGMIDADGKWKVNFQGTYYSGPGIVLTKEQDVYSGAMMPYFCNIQGNRLDHYANHMTAGYAALQCGRYQEAAGAFQAALRINPKDAAALYGLRQAQEQKLDPPPQKRPMVPNTADDKQRDRANALNEAFYGEWSTGSMVGAFEISVGEVAARNFLGDKVIFEPDYAFFRGRELRPVYYDKTIYGEGQYFNDWRAHYEELDLNDDTPAILVSQDPTSKWSEKKSDGYIVFMKDENTLITCCEGVWFELARVGRR